MSPNREIWSRCWRDSLRWTARSTYTCIMPDAAALRRGWIEPKPRRPQPSVNGLCYRFTNQPGGTDGQIFAQRRQGRETRDAQTQEGDAQKRQGGKRRKG